MFLCGAPGVIAKSPGIPCIGRQAMHKAISNTGIPGIDVANGHESEGHVCCKGISLAQQACVQNYDLALPV